MKKIGIIIINVLLLIAGILFAMAYSNHLTNERTEITKDAFKSTVETMVSVSLEQLNMHQEHVSSWSSYINSQNMTMDEAMLFLRGICTNEDAAAQIIDPETFTGFSTRASAVDSDDYTVDYSAYGSKTTSSFINMMQNDISEDYIYVTSAFSDPGDGKQVVAFGRRITLKTESGKSDDYLLLRLIYLDTLREQWVFPTEYDEAEIGLITLDGDYIIRSSSMKSENFYEFIRAYNDLTYPQKDELEQLVKSTESGVLEYLNARGVNSYWVYAGLQGSYGNWRIVGYVPVEALKSYGTDWPLVLSVAGILLVLFIIDGIYFVLINQRLHQSMEKAYQASQAKTRFLSSMSHDIRTPMNAIIGMTSIAKASMDDRDHLKESLDKITAASNHLLALINDILDISRVENGRLVLTPTVISLSDKIDNLHDIVRAQIEEKNLDFKINRINITNNYLYADDLRLSQIFINILSNAVKYTPKGGSITLTLQEIPAGDTHIKLIYTVADTGIGMDEEFLKTIFEPFTRVKDSRIDTVEGSGLGMAIVKQMVDAMGGSISVKSKLDQGSVFCVELTLKIASPPEDSSPKDQLQKGSGQYHCGLPAGTNLLIAEDNDLNWEIIHELLSYNGISSDRALNGELCVQMLKESSAGQYDAILMDIQMPVMNGYEAARAIRDLENDIHSSIPIIAMTANAFAEDVNDCLAAGMNGHVAKPVDMKLLMQELTKYSKGRIKNEQ